MDLLSILIEFDREKIDGRYRLAVAVSKRARALYQGAMPKITTNAKKMTTIALEEVIYGSVSILEGEAAVKAQQEAMKPLYQDVIDEAKRKKLFPEDLTELEKDLNIYLKEKRGIDKEEIEEEILPDEEF